MDLNYWCATDVQLGHYSDASNNRAHRCMR
jgi:hypothetical protein